MYIYIYIYYNIRIITRYIAITIIIQLNVIVVMQCFYDEDYAKLYDT